MPRLLRAVSAMVTHRGLVEGVCQRLHADPGATKPVAARERLYSRLDRDRPDASVCSRTAQTPRKMGMNSARAGTLAPCLVLFGQNAVAVATMAATESAARWIASARSGRPLTKGPDVAARSATV